MWCMDVLKRKKHLHMQVLLLSMGYKKDIFAVFAYEFEPSP